MERQTLTAEEVADMLGVSKHLIYRMARRGEVPSFTLGARRLFRSDSIERWLDEKESSDQVESM